VFYFDELCDMQITAKLVSLFIFILPISLKLSFCFETWHDVCTMLLGKEIRSTELWSANAAY